MGCNKFGNPVAPCPLLGGLVVMVVDQAGKTLDGVTAEVAGKNWSSLTSGGSADFGAVDPGPYQVKIEKLGYGPSAAGASGPVTVTINVQPDTTNVCNVTLCVLDKVTKITAKLPGTKGIRKAGDQLPENVLTPSTSSSESLSANAPVILVRGCGEVELAAETTPANKPVNWTVKSNENSDPPVAITPINGGKGAKLKTGTHGSFSVLATVGETTIVWNVVFVWVKVMVKTSVIKKRDNKYMDAGSNATWTRFRSGQFVAGQYPWEAKVQIKVVGGGKSKRLGTNKVKLHLLQNGVADTLTAHYTPPPVVNTALEVPKGGFPIRDSNGSGDPFMDNPTTISPDNTSFKRTLWTGDSPAGSFPIAHKTNGNAINGITGINGFVATVASVSDDAPNSIIVHAKTAWSADFKGTVDGTGVYSANGAKSTVGVRWELVSPATGGQDAHDAGFETFEPRFNGGTDTKWTP